MSRARGGFTLVELLVVVAVIAILAAIAVPNFQEVVVRARVARAESDMRVLATAAEAYRVDWGAYPYHGERLATGVVNVPASAAGITTVEFTPPLFTTPIAYLSSLPEDLTQSTRPEATPPWYGYIQSALMSENLLRRGLVASALAIEPEYGGWRLYAAGPDGEIGFGAKQNILYDPTNGTVSAGDLLRSQREPRPRLAEDEGSRRG